MVYFNSADRPPDKTNGVSSLRSRCKLDIQKLHSALLSSVICLARGQQCNGQQVRWLHYWVTWSTHSYSTVHIRRSWPSDPWFDRDCRDVKRLTRWHERYHAVAVRAAAAACRTSVPLDDVSSTETVILPHPLREHGVTIVSVIESCLIASAAVSGIARLRLIKPQINDWVDRLTLFGDMDQCRWSQLLLIRKSVDLLKGRLNQYLASPKLHFVN